MWFYIILSIIVTVVFHWVVISPYGYWKRKGIPGPDPTILVGNLGPSLRFIKSPGYIYKELYEKYKDLLYIGYYKFRQPALLIRDLDLVQTVLVKEFSSFHDNDIDIDEDTDPLFARNPFCLKGEKWKTIRTIIMQNITHSKVRGMFNLINTESENVVANMKTTELTDVKAKQLGERFTIGNVASCAFGLDGKSFDEVNAKIKEAFQSFSRPNFINGIKMIVTQIFPSLNKIFKIKIFQEALEVYFTQLVQETIRYRRENNVVRNDYLDVLLSLKTKSTAYEFKDLDVIAQSMTFYIDGFETSSIAISFALYEIATNPDIQEKLKKEIKTTLEKNNGEINYDTLIQMDYLDKVMAETVRKYPPVAAMSRLCTKNCDLPSPTGDPNGKKLRVTVGTPVIIPTLAIHMDPNIYPEPEKFIPERFTEENKATRHKYSYLGFGEGPRICLGFKFGLAQTKAAVFHVVKNYKISVSKKMTLPLEFDEAQFLTTPKSEILLNFEQRN